MFAPLIGCDEFEARGLLKDLIQTLQRRTLRAHRRMPTEAEVLDAPSNLC